MKTINILVADHSEATRKEFADFFEKRKDMHLMDSVDNGQDACNAILNRKPDIVLLDVVLPVMDGFSVIEKVNGDDSLLHAPAFIVVSSIGNQSMIECACKLGVAYYILKPFSLDNLARRILQIAAAREETLRQKKVEEETSGKKETRALSAAGYTESSLEADITSINPGDRDPGAYQGLSVYPGSDHDDGQRYQSFKLHYQTSVSYHRKEI